jgi:hypothetical protein
MEAFASRAERARNGPQLMNVMVNTIRDLGELASADKAKHKRMLLGWENLAEEGAETLLGVVATGLRMGVLRFLSPPAGVWEGVESDGAGTSRAGADGKAHARKRAESKAVGQVELGPHKFTLHKEPECFEQLWKNPVEHLDVASELQIH